MKVADLKDVLKSERGSIQLAVVYDCSKSRDVENGCSVDYAVEAYGDRDLFRIEAEGDKIVLLVE